MRRKRRRFPLQRPRRRRSPETRCSISQSPETPGRLPAYDLHRFVIFPRSEAAMKLHINGKDHEVSVPEEMPLLWVLRDVLGLTGTKFGCGMALCGACTVHLDGQALRSCVTPVSEVVGRKITTIEGLGANGSHPVQRAWGELDVVQ